MRETMTCSHSAEAASRAVELEPLPLADRVVTTAYHSWMTCCDLELFALSPGRMPS
jgi:uncharacterized protein (DUF697 family)